MFDPGRHPMFDPGRHPMFDLLPCRATALKDF